MSDQPTPNDMPGAPKAEAPEGKVEAPKEGALTPEKTGLSVEDAAELARLRKIHQDESKWEKRAKQNFEDAEKFRKFMQAAGGDSAAEFDPQAELQKLRSEIESERTERTRADVARLKGVDPEDVKGSTQEEMVASADRYLERFQARLDEALKAKTAPSAPPASTVTANDKIGGAEQITSRDQLKNMTPQEISAARKEGRLKDLGF